MPLDAAAGFASAEWDSNMVAVLGGLSHVIAFCLRSGLGFANDGTFSVASLGAGSTSMLIVNGASGVVWSSCWSSCLVTSTSQGCGSLVALGLAGSALQSAASEFFAVGYACRVVELVGTLLDQTVVLYGAFIAGLSVAVC
jgi:hypothetical protein